VKEAQKLDIPIIAMVDTNCDPDHVDFPVPANDDAIKSIDLVSSVISRAISEGSKQREVKQAAEKAAKEKIEQDKKEVAAAEKAAKEKIEQDKKEVAAAEKAAKGKTEQDKKEAAAAAEAEEEASTSAE
ncbi:MAG: 30S ribosomal protein S2, partial [Rhodothermales bacterium]|nr:30S ribosomal protein S2 [Rhodothermales bacterium]